MKIKKLDIISYGKFKDKEINLTENLNIVLGDNESGKSTIRNFIYDMIFGGTTPDSKRATFKKEHDNMAPWDFERFEGAMEISENNKDYYFYRNFNKNNLEFQIVDILTHKDSKSDFKIDTSRKVEKLDESYFEVSEKTLRDIFLITDEQVFGDLITYDLKDRIVNYATSKSENYSLKDVVSDIESKTFSKDIKKERQILENNLETLENELNYIDIPYNYKDYLEESKYLNDEIEKLKEELEYLDEDLEASLNINNYSDNKDRYNEVLDEKIINEEKLRNIEEKYDYYNYFKYFRLFYLFPVVSGIYYARKNLKLLLYSILILFIFLIVHKLSSRVLRSKKNKLKKEESRIYAVLDGLNYELMSLSNTSQNTVNSDSKEILNSINIIKDKISEKSIERESLSQNIKNIDKNLDRVKAINEEKEIIKSKIDEIDYYRSMGKVAIDIINELSMSNYNEVSLKVLKDSSEFFEFLTDGRYSAIQVKDNNLYVFSNYQKKYILAEKLSRGTISQMYLCYKLGIIKNSGIDFPIIIDDGFVFFDMKRNKNAIRLLENLSKDYQIIYFTSNYRDIGDLNESSLTKLIKLE